MLCEQNWDLPQGKDISRIFVCGASGQWIPNKDLADCSGNYTVSSSFYERKASVDLHATFEYCQVVVIAAQIYLICCMCTYVYKSKYPSHIGFHFHHAITPCMSMSVRGYDSFIGKSHIGIVFYISLHPISTPRHIYIMPLSPHT